MLIANALDELFFLSSRANSEMIFSKYREEEESWNVGNVKRWWRQRTNNLNIFPVKAPQVPGPESQVPE